MPAQQLLTPTVQGALSPRHVGPPSLTPASGTGDGPTSVVAHWAMWLCVEGSWNGSQKAGKLASTLPAAVVRSMAAIQICGCRQMGSVVTFLFVDVFSGDSGG